MLRHLRLRLRQHFSFSDSPATDGTEAIKRLTQDAEHWIFESDNSAYESIRVPKNEIAHPILGTMVEKLEALFRHTTSGH